MTKKEAKEQIKKLVAKYERLTPAQKKKYNEATTRKDFIMPLFKALGWDVYNNFISNEVVEEESVVQGTVDYTFRLNNIPQFLLEAKALKIDLDKIQWAKQAESYAWNMGIDWVVLTDFEGLKLFNAEWKKDTLHPNKEFTYKEYLIKFDELWLFSKESFQKGLLDKKAEKWGIKSKRMEVTEKLAKDLMKWRETLFSNLYKWNEDKYTEEEIDEAVQRILDRFIFIRSCEDRGIEEKKLWPAFKKWEIDKTDYNFMKVLKPVFKEFDDKYNSNLFVEHFCEKLDTEGQAFSDVINDLYGDKESGVKYNFAVIKPDILGAVYEQYLGHLLEKVRKNKIAEEKAKRKKQGIYYTPTFIVNYIVENTLGKLIEEKSVAEIENLKILDPACGSGSFLIKAFDVLDKKLKEERSSRTSPEHALRKYRVLTSNLYGVDLDEQAIEITRLNLLLKALEPKHKLPLLSENTKVGNSLISGTETELKKYFGKDWKKKKPFSWEDEFPYVFKGKNPGFDVVIGNPPYIRQEQIKEYKKIFTKSFPNVYSSTADVYVYFFERAMQILKNGGYFGFIVSNKFIRSGYGRSLRRYLQDNFKIIHLIDKFDNKVFKEVAVDPCVIILQKEKPSKNHNIVYNYTINVLQNNLSDKGWTFGDKNILDLKRKIESKGKKIKDWKDAEVYFGIKSGLNQAFVLNEAEKNKLIEEDVSSKEIIKPILRGRDIERYRINWKNKYLILAKIGIDISKYSAIYKHLEGYKKDLIKRTDYKPESMKWYNLRPCDYYDRFKKPKIIYPDISEKGGFYWDESGYFFNNTAYMIVGKVKKSWIAVLNSKLISWYYKQIASGLGDKGVRYFAQFMKEIPIPENTKELEVLADKMLKLNKELQKTTEKSDKWYKIKKEIEKTDKIIDQKVYKLYRLKEEEIRIVESNTG